MNVNEVIDFLKKAKERTYSSKDKYYLSNAIETLYNMKECNCFKNF